MFWTLEDDGFYFEHINKCTQWESSQTLGYIELKLREKNRAGNSSWKPSRH